MTRGARYFCAKYFVLRTLAEYFLSRSGSEVRRAREALPGAPSASRLARFLVAVFQFRPHFLGDGFHLLAGFCGVALRIQIAARAELIKQFCRERVADAEAPLQCRRARQVAGYSGIAEDIRQEFPERILRPLHLGGGVAFVAKAGVRVTTFMVFL